MKFLVIVACLLTGIDTAYAADSTIVHFGPLLKDLIKWLVAVLGTSFAAVATAVAFKALSYLGIQTAQAQRDQLQTIIVNGLNDAAVKAEASVAANPKLDIDVQQKVIADAVSYAQAHGAETIRALGLDPNSGKAVEAIKARIATAIADPATPTPAVLQPLAPK